MGVSKISPVERPGRQTDRQRERELIASETGGHSFDRGNAEKKRDRCWATSVNRTLRAKGPVDTMVVVVAMDRPRVAVAMVPRRVVAALRDLLQAVLLRAAMVRLLAPRLAA